MKYIITCLLLAGCNSTQPTLGDSSELSPTYYDKNHGVVCYTTYDEQAISCLQLK